MSQLFIRPRHNSPVSDSQMEDDTYNAKITQNPNRSVAWSTEYCTTNKYHKSSFYSGGRYEESKDDVYMRTNTFASSQKDVLEETDITEFEQDQILAMESLKSCDFQGEFTQCWSRLDNPRSNSRLRTGCSIKSISDLGNYSEYFQNRESIVPWIFENCNHFRFRKSTAFRVVSIMDKLMATLLYYKQMSTAQKSSIDRRKYYTQCKLKDIDNMNKLEPVVVTCTLMAMKLEEKEFIHLSDILRSLHLKTSENEIQSLEKSILEILEWKIASHNIYNFWSQHFYIYLTIFQPKMNLFQFENF